jgi:hypothetical protein
MPAAHETGRLGVRPDKLTKTEELKRSRAKSKTAAGKSVTAAICALWLLVASAEDQALGGESDARSQAIIATEDHAQEWDRAEALARALTSSLQGELDAVRSLAAAERIKQKQLLEQEQRRADNLAQDLASLRAELESTGIADLDLVRAAVAETKQKQIFEQDRKRVEDLTRELTSVQADLYKARAAALESTRANEAATIEQEQAIGKERDKTEALTRELASTKDELESGKRQIAALKAFHALRPSESTVCNSQDRTAEPGTRETAPELAPKATVETSQSTPTNAAHPITDAEQKLLARANTLLVRAEVRDARRLLRYAVRHGSAQAAFMLAETYDPRVPRSQLSCGSSGDRTKARELYERAWAGGVEDAKERIEALK